VTTHELCPFVPPPVTAQPTRESGPRVRLLFYQPRCASRSSRLNWRQLLNRAKHLPSLPLLRLVVLEREPTRPLVSARLPADPAIAAREQKAPEGNRSQERGAQRAETEGQDTCLGPHSVAVEGVDGVEDGGDSERGQRVRGFRVRSGCCGACGVG
jgi:hypothetical protein